MRRQWAGDLKANGARSFVLERSQVDEQQGSQLYQCFIMGQQYRARRFFKVGAILRVQVLSAGARNGIRTTVCH